MTTITKYFNKFMDWYGAHTGGEAGFIAAAMTAAPFVLNALGGIFGSKKKYIDPEMLRQKYGPQAVARDAQALTNYIINSPYGQQLMAQAAEAGQGLQTEMASRASASGLSPEAGGESGASTFAAAAGTQAQTGLERQTKASVWQAAMPIAAQQNAQYANLALQNQTEQNQEPSTFQKIAAASGQLAGGLTPGAKKIKLPGEKQGPSAASGQW